jgi:hypothetical protein
MQRVLDYAKIFCLLVQLAGHIFQLSDVPSSARVFCLPGCEVAASHGRGAEIQPLDLVGTERIRRSCFELRRVA